MSWRGRILANVALGAALLSVLPAAYSVAQNTVPAAQQPVAGMRGFSTTSRVRYPQDPERPHLLQAVHVFPDRSRWQRQLEGAAPTARDVEYRFGTAIHVLRQGKKYSEILEGDAATDVLLRMELRRAAAIFPSGFDWKPRAADRARGRTTRVLDLTAGRPRRAQPIGRLEAELDEDGRPVAIEAFDLEAKKPRYRVLIDGWFESEERTWPRTLTVFFRDRELWTEELFVATTRVDFLDAFFVPADKRDKNGRTVSQGVAIFPLDIVPFTYRLEPLEPDLDWDAAISHYVTLLEEEAEKLGMAHPLQTLPSFELDERGRPIRAMLRLEKTTATPPEGWSSTQERQGLTALHLRDEGLVNARRLKSMANLAPEDARPGTPYVRIVEGRNGREFNVVLPFETD